MRRHRRSTLDSSWSTAEQRDLAATKAEIAVNYGVIDIVDWLAKDYQHAVHGGIEHNSSVAHLRTGLAKLVDDDVRKEIDQIVGQPGPSDHPNAIRIALADHFWCDLFAAIARLAADLKANLDKMPHKIAEIIADSRNSKNNLVRPKRGDKPRDKKRRELNQKIIERAVKAALKVAWKPVQTLYGTKLDLLAKHARIMAILICPAPEHHRAVMEDCMKPLFHKEIVTHTVDRIKTSLYKDLFTPTRASSG